MIEIKLYDSPHPFAANSYLLSTGGECAIVDPTIPYDPSLAVGKVRYILLTHAHFDHILEVESWAKGSGAEVLISEEEKDALKDPMKNCFKLYNGTDNGYFGEVRGLKPGEILPLGDTEIEFFLCPGHTVGGGTYICDGKAFVGDTIFSGGGFGRFDLPGGNFTILRDSIKKLLNKLSDETICYPGHGESTSIKQYKLDLNINYF